MTDHGGGCPSLLRKLVECICRPANSTFDDSRWQQKKKGLYSLAFNTLLDLDEPAYPCMPDRQQHNTLGLMQVMMNLQAEDPQSARHLQTLVQALDSATTIHVFDPQQSGGDSLLEWERPVMPLTEHAALLSLLLNLRQDAAPGQATATHVVGGTRSTARSTATAELLLTAVPAERADGITAVFQPATEGCDGEDSHASPEGVSQCGEERSPASDLWGLPADSNGWFPAFVKNTTEAAADSFSQLPAVALSSMQDTSAAAGNDMGSSLDCGAMNQAPDMSQPLFSTCKPPQHRMLGDADGMCMLQVPAGASKHEQGTGNSPKPGASWLFGVQLSILDMASQPGTCSWLQELMPTAADGLPGGAAEEHDVQLAASLPAPAWPHISAAVPGLSTPAAETAATQSTGGMTDGSRQPASWRKGLGTFPEDLQHHSRVYEGPSQLPHNPQVQSPSQTHLALQAAVGISPQPAAATNAMKSAALPQLTPGQQSDAHLVNLSLLALRGVLSAVGELNQLSSSCCGRLASHSKLIHKLLRGAELRLRLQAFLLHHNNMRCLAVSAVDSDTTASLGQEHTGHCGALDSPQAAFVCCVGELIQAYDAQLLQLEQELLSNPPKAQHGAFRSSAVTCAGETTEGLTNAVPTALQLAGLLQPALTEIQLLASTCGCLPASTRGNTTTPRPTAMGIGSARQSSAGAVEVTFSPAEWSCSPAVGLLVALHADAADGGLGWRPSHWMANGFPAGQVLLEQLYAGVVHADSCVAGVLRQLFNATATPFLVQLGEWFIKGRACGSRTGGSGGSMPVPPAFLSHVGYEANVCGVQQQVLSKLAPQIGTLADRLSYIWQRELRSLDTACVEGKTSSVDQTPTPLLTLAFNPGGLQQVSAAISQASSLCNQEAQHVLQLLQRRSEAAAAATDLELLARWQEHAACQEADRQAKEAASAEARIARASLLAQQRQAADDAVQARQQQRTVQLEAEQQLLLAAAAQDHAAAMAELQSELRKLQTTRGGKARSSYAASMPTSVLTAAAALVNATSTAAGSPGWGQRNKGTQRPSAIVQQLQQQVARTQWRMKRLALSKQRRDLLQGLEALELQALRQAVGSARAAAATGVPAASLPAMLAPHEQGAASQELANEEAMPALKASGVQGHQDVCDSSLATNEQGTHHDGVGGIQGKSGSRVAHQAPEHGERVAVNRKPRRQWGPVPAAGMPSKRIKPLQLAHLSHSPTRLLQGDQNSRGRAATGSDLGGQQEPMRLRTATATGAAVVDPSPHVTDEHADVRAQTDQLSAPEEITGGSNVKVASQGRVAGSKAQRRQWADAAAWPSGPGQLDAQQPFEADCSGMHELPWDPHSLISVTRALPQLNASSQHDKEEQDNAPIATVMEVCVVQPVLSHYWVTSSVVWQLMLHELKFMELCASLRLYFFWEAGDFAQQLKDGMTSRWHPSPTSTDPQGVQAYTWGITNQQLASAWSEAVAASPVLAQHVAHGLEVSVMRAPQGRDVLRDVCGPAATAVGPLQAATGTDQQTQQQHQQQPRGAGSRHGVGACGIGDSLILQASVPWPASIIVYGPDYSAQHPQRGSRTRQGSHKEADQTPSSTMQTYADIASMLMRVRVCTAALQQGWLAVGKPIALRTGADGLHLPATVSSGVTAGGPLPPTMRATLARRLALLRSQTSEVLHFVGALQRHAIGMLRGSCWQRFEHVMLHSGPLDVWQMACHHQQYVEQAAAACFLPPRAATTGEPKMSSQPAAQRRQQPQAHHNGEGQQDSKLRLAVVHALECCEQFASLVAGLADTLSGTGTQSHASMPEAASSTDVLPALKKAHQQFRVAVLAVYRSLQSTSGAGYGWTEGWLGGGSHNLEATMHSGLLAELDCDWYARLASAHA